MTVPKNKNICSQQGFSLVELIISMVISLVILGVAVGSFSSALGSRDRQISKTDAITSVQAALNIMSREIGNSGYGLSTNGIVLADSNNKRLHFRANTDNSNFLTDGEGEDVTFFYDAASQSVLRYDKFSGVTSGLINRVSDVEFTYYNYTGVSAPTSSVTPAANTGRINIRLTVILPAARNQPASSVVVSSDITLRNSLFMRGQY